MKLCQKKREFNPISLVLESQEEAEVFRNIVDEVEGHFDIGTEERKLLVKISNAFSRGEVSI